MDHSRIFRMTFASVYPYYINKAEKKGHSKAEVDTTICWCTAPGFLDTRLYYAAGRSW